MNISAMSATNRLQIFSPENRCALDRALRKDSEMYRKNTCVDARQEIRKPFHFEFAARLLWDEAGFAHTPGTRMTIELPGWYLYETPVV